MKLIYRIYQLFVVLPFLIFSSIACALVTTIGCTLGDGHYWGYYPGKWWGRFIIWVSLLPIKVEGREHLRKDQSYVFVSNHQGSFDIFIIYGFLGRNFKWMMKKSLRKIPMVGYACYKAGHIYVDRGSTVGIRETMKTAEAQLSHGMSVVVFPEGSRSADGEVHAFRRGAYMLATEFNLPVVPVTIDGAFKVMPRQKRLPRPGHITITIHQPITAPDGGHDLSALMQQSRDAIISGLHNNTVAK